MALRDKVLEFVGSKGGSTTYREIYESLEYREQQELPRTLKALRKEGVTGEVIEPTPEGNVHKVWLVQESE